MCKEMNPAMRKGIECWTKPRDAFHGFYSTVERIKAWKKAINERGIHLRHVLPYQLPVETERKKLKVYVAGTRTGEKWVIK